MGRLGVWFVEWALQKRRWPLLLFYIGIPALFAFVTFYSGLSPLDALGDQNFLMGCGVSLLISGILYPAIFLPPFYAPPAKVRRAVSQVTTDVLRERSWRLRAGGVLALVGFILVLAGNVPPPISENPLIVGIARFTPVGGAEKEADLFKDSLIGKLNAMRDEDPDRTLLQVKNITSEVKGTMTDERIRFGKRLGISWTNNVHILVGGRVITRTGKEKPGTYIAPYVAFVRPLRNTRTSEREIPGNFQAEPELIEFPEAYAGNIADLALLVYGLAHYRVQDWNRAIEILSSVDSNAARFYKALCLQERANLGRKPKQDLLDAVSAYRNILGNDPRDWKITDGSDESDKLTHAAYYNGANALAELAKFSPPQNALDLFAVARELYEDAVVVRTREKVPLEWAKVQNNLGNVLVELGTRANDGSQELQAAVNAYNQALQVYAQRDEQRKYPVEWATAQNNLGNAYIYLGSREDGANDMLKDAVTAYNQAIQFYREAGSSQDLAMAYSNLGYALTVLGGREDGANEDLENAVKDCEKALEIRTREKMPQDWADTQNNLAYAQRELGNRLDGDAGTRRLWLAKDSCMAAFAVYDETDPMNWAMTKDNLGRSLCDLGVRLGGEDGKKLIKDAWAAHLEAANVHTRENLPQNWAYTQSNIAKALVALSKWEGGDGHLQQAKVMLKDVQSFYQENNYPAQYNEITALLSTLPN